MAVEVLTFYLRNFSGVIIPFDIPSKTPASSGDIRKLFITSLAYQKLGA